MRTCLIGCLVLLAIAGTAFCETKEPPKELAVDLGSGVKEHVGWALPTAWLFHLQMVGGAHPTNLAMAGTAFCETKEPLKELAVDLASGVKLPAAQARSQSMADSGYPAAPTAKAKRSKSLRHSRRYVATSWSSTCQ